MQPKTLQRIGHTLHLRRRGESSSSEFGRNPRADWQLMFVLFVIVNAVSLAATLFVYRQVNRGEIFLLPKKEPLSARILSRSELSEATEFLAKRKEAFLRLKDSSFVISDPGPARAKRQ